MSYLKHKPGSIEELMANEASKLNDNAYQQMFKKELDKAGKGIGGMSPKEKKDFFNKIDSKYKAKNEMNEARFEVEGRVDYKGVSGGDDFSIVIDASNEKAAEDKVSDMLFKHRDQRKIGPRGGRGVDDYEIESVTRTSKSVTNKFSTYHAAEYKVEAKVDELTKAQEKLPPALQKVIAKKMSGKTEEDLDTKELQTKKTDNYKSKNESWKQAWEAATHKMPDGTIMKGAKHKDEALDSKDTKTVKDVVNQLKGATKAHSAQAKDLEKAMKNEADDVDNGDEKKDTKKKLHADSGSKLTKVETEPSVDYKN